MDVGVNESREEVEAGSVDLLCVRAGLERSGLTDLRQLTVADDQIEDAVDPGARINQVRAGDHQVGFGRRATN